MKSLESENRNSQTDFFSPHCVLSMSTLSTIRQNLACMTNYIRESVQKQTFLLGDEKRS